MLVHLYVLVPANAQQTNNKKGIRVCLRFPNMPETTFCFTYNMSQLRVNLDSVGILPRSCAVDRRDLLTGP